MSIELHSNSEARQHFIEQFESLTTGEKWLAAVWIVDDSGKLVLANKSSFNFPRNKFNESVGELAMVLSRETVAAEKEDMYRSLPNTPLPAAVGNCLGAVELDPVEDNEFDHECEEDGELDSE